LSGSVWSIRFDSLGNSFEVNVSAASALVALAAAERVELVLDGALDDQLRAEAGQLGQRAFGVRGGHSFGEQGVDLGLDLRRRRYGASHGVGLPSWSCRT
jgi:hypothetical protein